MMSPFYVDVQLDETSESGLMEENMYRLPADIPIPSVRMWMDIGDMEGLFRPSQVRKVAHQLLERGATSGEELAFLEQQGACHQEGDWGARVHLPLLYMFGRVGRPTSIQLLGRGVIGLQGGMTVCINAQMHYESGLVRSLLHGNYTSSNPDVIQVRSSGELVPVGIGSASITLTVGELSTTRIYTVIPELSTHVEVCIHAEVAPDEDWGKQSMVAWA